MRRHRVLLLSICCLLLPISGWPDEERALRVTATAYNSLPGQTYGHPQISAWGKRLRPGMKAIAVSRDLISRGLTLGTRVRIDGLPGIYVVVDKMHRRWRRRIDIYMGMDIKAAKNWGKRRVTIHWSPAEDPADYDGHQKPHQQGGDDSEPK